MSAARMSRHPIEQLAEEVLELETPQLAVSEGPDVAEPILRQAAGVGVR